MSCLCTDDDALECCGGGLPRTTWGECSCSCHDTSLWARLAKPAPAEHLGREVAEDRGTPDGGVP